MQARARTTEDGRAVIWCETCGVPYAETTTHCSLCGTPLADDLTPPASAGVPVAAAPRALAAPATVSGTDGITPDRPTTLAEPPAGAPAARLRRLRSRPLSEDEVESAAAAIIARAREEIASGATEPAPRDPHDPLPDFIPDPLEEALLKRQERDRLWLIAGVICSVLLILFALAMSRYLAGGLPPT